MNNDLKTNGLQGIENDDLVVLKQESGKDLYLEPRLSKLYNLLNKNLNHVISRDILIDEMVCIPVGWWVSKENRDYIVESIKEFYN